MRAPAHCPGPHTAAGCRTRAAVPRRGPPRNRARAGRRRPSRSRGRARGRGCRRDRSRQAAARTPDADRTALDRRTRRPGRTAARRSRRCRQPASSRSRPHRSRPHRGWARTGQRRRSRARRRPVPRQDRQRTVPASLGRAGARRRGRAVRSPTWAEGPRPCGIVACAGARTTAAPQNAPSLARGRHRLPHNCPRHNRPRRDGKRTGRGRCRDSARPGAAHLRTDHPRRRHRRNPRLGNYRPPCAGPAGNGSSQACPGDARQSPRDRLGHEDPNSPGGDGAKMHPTTIALPGIQPQAKSAGPPGEGDHAA